MERKWWTLVLVSIATFMLLLDVTIVNVALPDIQRELHASLSSLQWVVDAYSLTLAAFLLTAGSLGDRLGRRRVFTIGFAIFTFASFLCGIANDPTLLNLARGLQGVGGAGMFATSLALILVIGFALHNATEGFGIAGPLASGELPSWRFLGGLGLIGGGPTFVGGVVGYSFVSPLLSIAFLGLAAGALVFVFNEMMAASRRLSVPMMATTALLIGLLAGFGTDFILTAAGA